MAILETGTPAALDGTSSPGSSRFPSRSDHKHAIDIQAIAAKIGGSFATSADLAAEAAARREADNVEALARQAADLTLQSNIATEAAARAAADASLESRKADKSRLPYNFLDYGGAPGGVTDNVAAFQSLLAIVSAAGGGTIYVPKGVYWFNITGDSSCLMVPSNTTIYGEPGTVFKWSYWGSPLIGIVEVQNVCIRDIAFEWGGTFGTTSGSRTFKTYSRTLPAYQYCAHIVDNGSDYVTFRNLRFYGTTTSNNQNQGIQIAGYDDGVTQSKGLVIDNLVLDDLCQGIGIEGQTGFQITNLFSNRHSQASAGLYGPGHVMYMLVNTPCSNGIVSGVFDVGTTNDTNDMSGHTLSCKYLNNVVVSDVASSRPAGPLNWTQCTGVLFKSIKFTTGSALYDTSAAAIQYTGQGGASSDVAFRDISLYWTLNSSVNQPPFTIAVDANPPTNVTVSGLVIRRYMTGTEVGSIQFGGINGSLDATIIHDGSGTVRALLVTRSTTAGNLFNIKSTGSNPSTTIDTSAFGTGSNNRYNVRIDTSDVWINENEVNGLVADLAAKLAVDKGIATTGLFISAAAPYLWFNDTDYTVDYKIVVDGGNLTVQSRNPSTDGSGTLIRDQHFYILANGDVGFGRTSGGTYNGNFYISGGSDQFPGLRFRGGTTTKAQMLGDANVGDLYIDVTTARSVLMRDGIGGGGGSIATWKLTGSVVLSPLKVTSATAAATPAANEVTFGGGMVKAYSGAVLGTDPGGSETLRVGGGIRLKGGNDTIRIVQTVDNSFNIQVNLDGTTDGGNLNLQPSGGSVVIGTDPGGSELLRVGGSIRATAWIVNNGCTVSIAGSNTGHINFNAATASTQAGIQFSDAGTAKWTFYKDTDNSMGLYDFVNSKKRFEVDLNGNTVLGAQAALATSATNGFVYIPTCAGAPSGTPTAKTGMVPIVYDTTNNKLYAYNGAWKQVALT